VPFAEGIREVLAWMYTRERDVEESGVKR